MSSAQLVERNEEPTEFGGYFIINGNERMIRCLISPKANHALAIERGAFADRGPFYTKKAVSVRSQPKDDLLSMTNTIHYLENGNITLRFSWRKQEFMIPAVMVLKALVDATDKEIFTSIAQGDYENTFLTNRVEVLLRSFKAYSLVNGNQCLEYIGDKFRVVMGAPDDWDNYQVGARFISQIVLVHLASPREKYRMLVHMIRKLYSNVADESCLDNEDSPQCQDILLPGFLYGQIIKERLEGFITEVRQQIQTDFRFANSPTRENNPRASKITPDLFDVKYINASMGKVPANIGARLASFLATGNLVSQTGLDLKQATGFTIVAEKLNYYRYLSHFRSVHRGAFFAELKTTAVRKLLPEAWGFLCPVHTPDGAPCGLLNHFSHTCKLMTRAPDASRVPEVLSGLGMVPTVASGLDMAGTTAKALTMVVMLDGMIIGHTTPELASRMAYALRVWKTEGERGIPLELEIGLVPPSHSGQFPGLYLFSNRSRMMRPVTFLANGKPDMVGPFEQVYLDVACQPEDVKAGLTSHIELAPTSVLSVLANLTPFSDYNQSPRNMYQCQMAKQTMGTASTALNHRTDNKLYRIQTPQTPIVRPRVHNKYSFDDYPNGTNAIVAVISYTGYDMEDAMILNKSAHERGFGYGVIYKSAVIDLAEKNQGTRSTSSTVHLGFGPDVPATSPFRERIDPDGLPKIGERVNTGDPYLAYWDEITGTTSYEKMKGDDFAYVDTVRVIGTDVGVGAREAQKVQITLRIPRSPVIGDKFSSRHGQKGVCSQKWPQVDMPFSESGMQPDVIINPHAFPSRMTIGMLIESMAGKAGAMHGISQDSTPWSFNEDDTPVDFFGEQLVKAGYNYMGHEPMYSGITGEQFPADIYLGVVYYQRLRHMVNDKFQVRTTGPIDQRTHQPVKGRKRQGGIRLGEMERDAMLAHGTAFLLQDRLMNCSDYSTAWVCRRCGSLVSVGYEETTGNMDAHTIDLRTDHTARRGMGPKGEFCRLCRAEDQKALLAGASTPAEMTRHTKDNAIKVPRHALLRSVGELDVVAVPYVLRYLVAELAAMNMRIRFDVQY